MMSLLILPRPNSTGKSIRFSTMDRCNNPLQGEVHLKQSNGTVMIRIEKTKGDGGEFKKLSTTWLKLIKSYNNNANIKSENTLH